MAKRTKSEELTGKKKSIGTHSLKICTITEAEAFADCKFFLFLSIYAMFFHDEDDYGSSELLHF